MSYFLCGRDHYVSPHRGETLKAGGTCPARDCGSKLRPAPEPEEARTCQRCSKGLLLETTIDDLDVDLCSFCGHSWPVSGQEGPGEPVTVKPRAMTGAERVAKHREAKRAAGRMVLSGNLHVDAR